MAGIVQAAEWMREGKRVTRTDFCGYPVIYDESGQDIPARQIGDVVHQHDFTITDLLADDWEIAQ